MSGKFRFLFVVCMIGCLGLTACRGGDGGLGGSTIESRLSYDQDASRVLIVLNRELKGSEDLHARIRSLAEGDQLDCEGMAAGIPTWDSARAEAEYEGPEVEESMFETPTTPETLLGETEASYQERQANTWFVDVCVMDGSKVKHQARYDLRQALDKLGAGGKVDAHDDGVRIVSNQAYAEACIGDMGDIPFWGERVGEDGEPDWGTVDCLEIATPIPSTIDGEPQTEHRADKCDQPQYIYSHCEADARTEGVNGPRVAHARNDQGTHWVLLCRKSHRTEGRYEDIAMIGHNPFTGQTCFFQNQLPYGETEKPSNNGMAIPHPADNVSSESSPLTWSDMWGGIEGGIGPEGGIQCAGCHSTDAFIHSPWIDGAKNPDGTSVVPKMGENPDFVIGYNGPYRLLDAEDQGWTMPKVLVSPEAGACTKCHRIGLDQWTASSSITSRNNPDGGSVFSAQAPWADRLEGLDERWSGIITESNKSFRDIFWMPTNADEFLNEEVWPDSDFKKSLDFIRHCGANPGAEECVWESLPEEPGDPSELPEIEATGPELATEALAILGAPHIKDDAEQEGTRRCAECHAVSRNGFRDWLEATQTAIDAGLDPRTDPTALTQEQALELVTYMRRDATEDSVFSAFKIGIFAPGTQFPYFQKLFQTAYGNEWGIPYGAFLQRVSMPKGSHPPMSAEEFATVLKWFVDEELAHIDELLPEVPPPATCADVEARYGVSGASVFLQNHIDDMQFDGWAARNLEAGINMYGCTSELPMDCFKDAAAEAEWAAMDLPSVRVIEVKDLGFDTSFWMRSSADGRFVGNGGRGGDQFGATVTDLVTGKNIGVQGSYDPGFFPNNDGFIMQGGGAGLCGQSVLTQEEAIADGIDFSEAGCSKAEGINLYQHVAVSLDGGDYFIINSQFTSDSGSASNTDPRAPFSETSTMKFTPLIFDGETWTQKESIVVDSPYEGDSVLSPSGKLVISRFAGPDGTALGYMVRRVATTPNSSGSYDIDIKTPATFVCGGGAKANISFDERFAVTHSYENDTANIYLIDLLDGTRYQVTNMPAGTKALFPHFRSDGWIYFLVKGEGGDRAMATDAALVLAAQ